MTDTESPVPAEATKISKPASKKGKASPKKPIAKKVAPSHPKVSEMVVTAVTSLKERGGSSLQAIKKYVAANYTVDVEKLAPFIRKYLKGAVIDGTLVQTKGTGASGSFKLGGKKEKPKAAVAKPVAEIKKTVKPEKPTAAKKAAKPAKKAVKSPKKVAKSPTTKKATKSPIKAKSPKAKSLKKAKAPNKEKKAKSPRNPKSPKPKKAVKKTTIKK